MLLMERDREKMLLGRFMSKVEAIRKMTGHVPPEEIADYLSLTSNDVDEIAAFIDAHPEWDDEEVAENLFFA